MLIDISKGFMTMPQYPCPFKSFIDKLQIQHFDIALCHLFVLLPYYPIRNSLMFAFNNNNCISSYTFSIKVFNLSNCSHLVNHVGRQKTFTKKITSAFADLEIVTRVMSLANMIKISSILKFLPKMSLSWLTRFSRAKSKKMRILLV